MGAKLVKEAASKTSTTPATARPPAPSSPRRCSARACAIAAGVDANGLVRGMKQAVETATKAIDELATPIEGKKDIQNVATISANNDPEVGKIMADAFDGRQGRRHHRRRGQEPRDRGHRRRGHAVRSRLPVANFVTDADA
jgi:chaperonin GroEL